MFNSSLVLLSESGLTAAALNQHDAKFTSTAMDTLLKQSVQSKEIDQDDKEDSVGEMEDARSVASSWATEFSACTNMSFNKLMVRTHQ